MSKIANWAKEGVAWAYEDKVMSGKGENLFDPDGDATRAELAALLTRYRTKDTQETEEE